MTTLADIRKGKHAGPRRILLYGTHGIGKSTFAASAKGAIFISTEDGLGNVDCASFPLCKSYEDVIACLTTLVTNKHEYKTVVIDSLDWLERMVWENVCGTKGWESIESPGYGKGYVETLKPWQRVLDGLGKLREAKGMTVLLIAHCKTERFENPNTDSYDKYTPRLHKVASGLIQEWCDEILFACYKVHTKQTDEGFNRKRTRAVGDGARVMYASERPSHTAKNRLGLADELPFKWESLNGQKKKEG